MLAAEKRKKEEDYLFYIPRIRHSTWEIRSSKVCLIFQEEKPLERLVRRLVQRPVIRDLELDEIGSEVWLMIDGRRSVYEIGRILIDKYGEGCQPVYDRLIMYLRYLNRRGWISCDRDSFEKRGETCGT